MDPAAAAAAAALYFPLFQSHESLLLFSLQAEKADPPKAAAQYPNSIWFE